MKTEDIFEEPKQEFNLNDLIKRLNDAQERIKQKIENQELAAVLTAFSTLYQHSADRDSYGPLPTDHNKKLIPMLDTALEKFLAKNGLV
jgi:hypothetical protein